MKPSVKDQQDGRGDGENSAVYMADDFIFPVRSTAGRFNIVLASPHLPV